MTVIPADAVLRLREALYGQLGNVAEELASAERDPAREAHGAWAEPVARFDRARALLDQIGWNERDPEHDAQIDLDQHRAVILEALTEALENERYLLDQPGNLAEPQRQRAYGHALIIESFLETLRERSDDVGSEDTTGGARW